MMPVPSPLAVPRSHPQGTRGIDGTPQEPPGVMCESTKTRQADSGRTGKVIGLLELGVPTGRCRGAGLLSPNTIKR